MTQPGDLRRVLGKVAGEPISIKSVKIDCTTLPRVKFFISDRFDLSGSTQASTPTLSCFINGLLTVLAQLLTGKSLSFGRLFPLPFSHFHYLTFTNSS
ncbi:MAG: hypothetical protein AAF383_27580 [Cyanobacteria bacterium P01_A01_bin.83]